MCTKNLKDLKKDLQDLKDLPRLKATVFETKDTELFEEIFEYRIPLFDFGKGRISNHFVSTRDSSFVEVLKMDSVTRINTLYFKRRGTCHK